jgi:catecholate siderophore receptor
MGAAAIYRFHIALRDVSTKIWRRVELTAYMDSEAIKSAPDGSPLGAPLTITPRNSSAFWTDYQLSKALEIGAGALQDSGRLGQDAAASYEVAPGYVRFSAMAKYEFSAKTTLQLNVNNLTNRYYIDQLRPFHAIPGEGCMAQLALYVRY